MRVILASQSPRRRQLLEHWGVEFTVVPADVDETPRAGEEPGCLVRRLAVTKAVTVGTNHPQNIIVAADTAVAYGRTVLGKPRDPHEAASMLQMLSGNRHEVYTGVGVWRDSTGRGLVQVDVAHVTFRTLEPWEIEAYVSTGEPMDKAGAYAVQGGAGAFVESYEGNLDTVIGLSGDVLKRLLTKFYGD